MTIGPNAELVIQDRCKDLVKSGGEWISSVLLENYLMGHPVVAEAAVIGVPHPQWVERPLAVVVARPGQAPQAQELRDFLSGAFARWWVPDAIVFAEALPRSGTGKVLKLALRGTYKDMYANGSVPDRNASAQAPGLEV